MQIDLSLDEMRLAVLALQRMRMEIDVDNSSKCTTMNHGQSQACRFTLRFTDDLIGKLSITMKEALGGTGSNS